MGRGLSRKGGSAALALGFRHAVQAIRRFPGATRRRFGRVRGSFGELRYLLGGLSVVLGDFGGPGGGARQALGQLSCRGGVLPGGDEFLAGRSVVEHMYTFGVGWLQARFAARP